MNNEYLDIILFGALAVFLIFRLRSVLGRRTGTERPPMAPRVIDGGRTGQPGPAVAPGFAQPVRPNAIPDAPIIDATASRVSEPVAGGIAAIRAADPTFRLDHFMNGAKSAFEMIVKAFAAGDTATLRLLLSDDVYDSFAEVIRKRLAAKESVDTKIVTFHEPEIMGAEMNGRTASMTVKFTSDQISVSRDAAGAIIEGDPEKPSEHIDVWTFAHNTRSADPNWFLVATGAHD